MSPLPMSQRTLIFSITYKRNSLQEGGQTGQHGAQAMSDEGGETPPNFSELAGLDLFQ
jgi:hypothetical protein